MNVAQSFAVPFTPSVSAVDWDVVLPLQVLSGPPSMIVDIASDAFGVPGPMLTALTQNGTIPSNSPAIVSFTCSSICPTLTAGTQFWIVTAPSYGNTFIYWYWSNSELGNYDSNMNGSINGPWYPSIYNTPVFEVDSVPEPASALFVSGALLGVAIRIALSRQIQPKTKRLTRDC
jgi:hypothetical protein